MITARSRTCAPGSVDAMSIMRAVDTSSACARQVPQRPRTSTQRRMPCDTAYLRCSAILVAQYVLRRQRFFRRNPHKPLVRRPCAETATGVTVTVKSSTKPQTPAAFRTRATASGTQSAPPAPGPALDVIGDDGATGCGRSVMAAGCSNRYVSSSISPLSASDTSAAAVLFGGGRPPGAPGPGPGAAAAAAAAPASPTSSSTCVGAPSSVEQCQEYAPATDHRTKLR